MQHAKEILGISFYSFKFDNIIWTTINDVRFNHKPTRDDISTTNCHGNGNGDSNHNGNGNGNQKSTPQWQLNSPASGHPSVPMEQKSTLQWQLESPALGQPSTSMAMNKKSTPQWRIKSPALGKPSALMVNQPTPKWHPVLGFGAIEIAYRA